ncbi:BBA14 family lipoprotein [Borreliella lusitaniae]|uniref:BBA14 family lipoprotein n=1 Tax=Borreliella lusitaniae TaxID=100177 RepID=A0ACD5GMS8_9SPIR
MQKIKINFLVLIWLLLVFTSCESIPTLPQKPNLINKDDNESLVLDEAELFRYSTSLNVWLLTVKAYANKHYANEKFPTFENFDTVFSNANANANTNTNEIEITNMLKNRIKHYKHYISKTEPIVFECYKKYSKR